VDEGSLGLHEVELVIDPREHFCDCSRVGDHTDCSHDLGEVSSGHHCWRLLVDTAFEAGRAPVYKLDGSLGLDGSNRGIYVLRDNIASLHEAAGHLLPVTRVTLGHHGCRFECTVGDFGHG